MRTVNDLRSLIMLETAKGLRPKERTSFTWMEEEDSILISMRSAGEFSFKEISRAIPGRTPAACIHRWRALMGGEK